MQIDWQEENVSNAAHVVSSTRRTIGNALVGPTKMSKSPPIVIMRSILLGYSSRRRVQYDLATNDHIEGRPHLGGTTFVGMSCQERKGRNPTCYIHQEYERLALWNCAIGHKCSPSYSNAAWHPPSYSNAAWHRNLDTSDTCARTHTLNNTGSVELYNWMCLHILSVKRFSPKGS